MKPVGKRFRCCDDHGELQADSALDSCDFLGKSRWPRPLALLPRARPAQIKWGHLKIDASGPAPASGLAVYNLPG
jgi:hypothetical protein